MADAPPVKIKRIYVSADDRDGFRVLVDRLWPRGVKRADARVDHWAKDVAPTTQLRRRFDHRADRFAEYPLRYLGKLAAHADAVRDLKRRAGKRRITLLAAVRDASCNHAIVLRELLSRA